MILFREVIYEEWIVCVVLVVDYFCKNEIFKILKKWCNEFWFVYGCNGELFFSMECVVFGFLGVVWYGVYMIVYVCDDIVFFGVKFWIGKCVVIKEIFLGMFDNIVVGGFMIGEDLFECIICEVDEEVSLFEDIVCLCVEYFGIIIYIYIINEV